MDDIERQQDGLDRANALAEEAGRRRQLLEQEVNLLRGKPSVIPSERAKQEEALKSVHTKQVESQRRYEKEVSSFQTPQQVEQAMRQEFGRTEPRKIDLVETDVLQKLKERRIRKGIAIDERAPKQVTSNRWAAFQEAEIERYEERQKEQKALDKKYDGPGSGDKGPSFS
ncbi:TPA: hypothetical protein ACOEOO_001879 [Stenotrophomonas maltophilia]|uniref:hypothetical protein n=1 Tax=Stenotrophomonas maltophilia group TaxID=995085 RepID=UPI002448DB15|nr:MULTISPECIES: hypothetical protein [Stenotrophomonas maltophilia group]MDH2038267.1 hypothetical protein [Stenotrophomonas maltophilia]MDT3488711.1 hypothetical protein [Stenotrophomonas maltophilia group sp. msm4]